MSIFGAPVFHGAVVDVGAPKRTLDEDEEFHDDLRRRLNRPQWGRPLNPENPSDVLHGELYEAIQRGNALEEHAGRLIADHNALDAEHERLREAHRFLQMKHVYVVNRREQLRTWVYKAFYDAIVDVDNNADDLNFLLNLQHPPIRNALLNHVWSNDEVDYTSADSTLLFYMLGDMYDGPFSWTPLCLAAFYGNEAAVPILEAAGAEIHALDDIALRMASFRGHDTVVARLLEAGADVHARVDQALLCAASEGHDAVVARLIAAGADIHAGGDSALTSAAGRGHDAVVARLIAAGADIHAGGDSALTSAAGRGHDAVVALLLAKGEYERYNVDHALRIAIASGHDEAVRRLRDWMNQH